MESMEEVGIDLNCGGNVWGMLVMTPMNSLEFSLQQISLHNHDYDSRAAPVSSPPQSENVEALSESFSEIELKNYEAGNRPPTGEVGAQDAAYERGNPGKNRLIIPSNVNILSDIAGDLGGTSSSASNQFEIEKGDVVEDASDKVRMRNALDTTDGT